MGELSRLDRLPNAATPLPPTKGESWFGRASVYGTEGCWFEPSGVYFGGFRGLGRTNDTLGVFAMPTTTRTTAPTIEPRGPGGRPRNWEPTPAGQRIEKLAARQGLRLQDVAERAGISVACIYGIVSGRTVDPRVSIAQAIAAALGVKLEKLFPPKRDG